VLSWIMYVVYTVKRVVYPGDTREVGRRAVRTRGQTQTGHFLDV
jgi:hypothetical protein